MSPKAVTGPAAYTGPLSTYFDSLIQQWYTTWGNTPVVTQDKATRYYTGLVVAEGAHTGELAFYEGDHPTKAELDRKTPAFYLTGGAPENNKVISTWDVWQCAGSLATGDTAQLNVGKIIAAALNRGITSNSMTDIDCAKDSTEFYPHGVKSNVWPEMFHKFNSNRLAYGFPYDDVCDQNPSISLSGTTSVDITIGSLS